MCQEHRLTLGYCCSSCVERCCIYTATCNLGLACFDVLLVMQPKAHGDCKPLVSNNDKDCCTSDRVLRTLAGRVLNWHFMMRGRFVQRPANSDGL